MDGLARAAGASVVIKFDGEDLILDPIVISDYGTIEQHLLKTRRPNLIVMASEAAQQITDAAESQAASILAGEDDSLAEKNARAEKVLAKAQARADAIMNKAFSEARKSNSISQQEAQEFIDSPAGLAFCIWLKLHQRYPAKFTQERVYQVIQSYSEDQLQELMQDRDRASARDLEGNSIGPQA